jgi:LuxR family transcriptional regulator, quorum-sensing system regulator BjaR1
MTTTAGGFGQEAFTFIDGLDRLHTPDAIMRAMHRVVSRFGFEWLVFTGLVPKPGETFDDLVLAEHAPDGFHALYNARDYIRCDPNVHRAVHSSHPFDWTWQDYGDEHGPRSVEIMRVLADFTLARGFIVPIHGVGGYEAAVAMAGTQVAPVAEARAGLHLMSLYAFERLRHLAGRTESKPPLTRREREVLAWSAQGKSAWEIGEILSVGKRTVDEHAQTAMRKLGAANRTQAVAIALRHRLFDV